MAVVFLLVAVVFIFASQNQTVFVAAEESVPHAGH